MSLDSCSLESGLKGTFRATLPRLLELLCLFKSRSTDRLCLANQNNYRRRLDKRDSTSSEQRLAILFSSEIASTFPSFLLQVSKSTSLLTYQKSQPIAVGCQLLFFTWADPNHPPSNAFRPFLFSFDASSTIKRFPILYPLTTAKAP